MNKIKILLSFTVILAVLSCSKLPFGKKEEDKSIDKELELKKREDDIKAKEDALRDMKNKQLEQDKEDLKKKEEELDKKINELKVESKIKAIGDPSQITLALIQNIDNYVTHNNEASLRRSYNFWYNPLSSIGTFDKFKNGFSNTLSNKVLDNTVLSNDGYNAEVLITHFAYEINPKSTGAYDTYQKTKYEAKYKMVSDNGSWKIRSGKVTILSRVYTEYYK